ncbi:MAG: hypothetical protein LRY41_01190 [Candidatus Pacebacteria bacterium]|nr:hypothetical protein [Candidatus Paceibacterota bacterium]MCD8508410.1 hypothetical protein [Candidatus Paceibacterota bacterium]MCD8527931.1 hypothetical protein [Candidatus Paceibacterota bacterium]MCD8563725.1 hypothetical protein [Candidatus Paceibacterota bacterium]
MSHTKRLMLGLVLLALIVGGFLGMRALMRSSSDTGAPRNPRAVEIFYQENIDTLFAEKSALKQNPWVNPLITETRDVNGDGVLDMIIATGQGGVYMNEFEVWTYLDDVFVPLEMRYLSGRIDTVRLSEGSSVFYNMGYEFLPQIQGFLQFQEDFHERADENGRCFVALYTWSLDRAYFVPTTPDSAGVTHEIFDRCTLSTV